MIDSFRGKYAFLSNFYECKIHYNGHTFKSSEAAFHAQKDPSRAAEFKDLNPIDAKKLGRKVNLRSDWEDVKLGIMREILYAKFSQNSKLCQWLINTGNEELVEGNHWGDIYWGVCTNRKYDHVGENNLGKLLMELRENILRGDILWIN